MEYRVTVQIGGEDVSAGTLYCHVRNGVESASFRYDDAYLQDSRSFALAPDMPLTAGALHSQGDPLFRVFEDCMPDRWGRNLLLREERRMAKAERRAARTLFEHDLLAGVSDSTRQGAIRIWRDGEPCASEESGVPREVNLPVLLDAADHAVTDADSDLGDLLTAGSSLGGARPKASVVDDGGFLCIAKFPKADESQLEDVCAWEKVALDLAERCGMQVPARRLLRVGGRAVLLVRRFDRVGVARIPFMSGLTAVQGQDGGTYSYLELADFLETSGAAPERDLRELWRRILFSCAIGNTDDHMRNHGFVREGSGWRLSPLYDVNPTPGDNPKHLRCTVDFDNSEAVPETALSVCEYFRVSPGEARDTARSMAVQLAGWQRHARTCGISPASQERMRSCFEAGIERLRAIHSIRSNAQPGPPYASST